MSGDCHHNVVRVPSVSEMFIIGAQGNSATETPTAHRLLGTHSSATVSGTVQYCNFAVYANPRSTPATAQGLDHTRHPQPAPFLPLIPTVSPSSVLCSSKLDQPPTAPFVEQAHSFARCKCSLPQRNVCDIAGTIKRASRRRRCGGCALCSAMHSESVWCLMLCIVHLVTGVFYFVCLLCGK